MSRLPGEPSGCSRVAPLQYRLLGALASTVALGRCPSRRFRDDGGVGCCRLYLRNDKEKWRCFAGCPLSRAALFRRGGQLRA